MVEHERLLPGWHAHARRILGHRILPHFLRAHGERVAVEIVRPATVQAAWRQVVAWVVTAPGSAVREFHGLGTGRDSDHLY